MSMRNGWHGGLLLAVAALLVSGLGAQASDALSLTLADAIELALEQNRTLAGAEASEEAARARLAQANAAFLPKITGSASYTRLDEVPYMDASGFGDMFAPLAAPFDSLVQDGYLNPAALEGLSGGTGSDRITMGDDDIYSIALQVQQPLFTGGALLNARSAASHGLRAAEANTRRTGDETRYAVTEAYVGAVQARAALAVTGDAVEQMGAHLSDLEAMYAEGMLIESDIMRARVQMSEVELQHNAAEHLVQLAEASLAFQIGLDPGTRIEAVDPLTSGGVPERSLDDWTERALAARPDLLGVSEGVKAAGNAVAIARAEYLPQLVFVGSYGWDRPDRSYDPEFYEHWSATLALEMNIFDWFGRENRVREAGAVRREAEHGLAMMKDAVVLDVKRCYLELDEAARAVEIAERGVVQARESMRVTRESFRSGVASNSDVLDAQTALTGSEMNRVAALARLRLAEAGLDLATGVASDREEIR